MSATSKGNAVAQFQNTYSMGQTMGAISRRHSKVLLQNIFCRFSLIFEKAPVVLPSIASTAGFALSFLLRWRSMHWNGNKNRQVAWCDFFSKNKHLLLFFISGAAVSLTCGAVQAWDRRASSHMVQGRGAGSWKKPTCTITNTMRL